MMKNVMVMFCVVLIMNVGFLFGTGYFLDTGSDLQVWLVIILWSAGSIFGAIRFHRQIGAQTKRTFLHKLGLVTLYLLSLLPVSLVGFFVFLTIALDGADFK